MAGSREPAMIQAKNARVGLTKTRRSDSTKTLMRPLAAQQATRTGRIT
jgi:hypothetical protein